MTTRSCKCGNVSISNKEPDSEKSNVNLNEKDPQKAYQITVLHESLVDMRDQGPSKCLYCQQVLFERKNGGNINQLLVENDQKQENISSLFGISLNALAENQDPANLKRISAYLKQFESEKVNQERQKAKLEIKEFERNRLQQLSKFVNQAQLELSRFLHLLPSTLNEDVKFDSQESAKEKVRMAKEEQEIFDNYRDTMDLMVGDENIDFKQAGDEAMKETESISRITEKEESGLLDSSNLLGTSVPISIPKMSSSFKTSVPVISEESDEFVAPHILGPQTYKQLNPMSSIFGEKPKN